jgi:acyl-CoA thioesterase YciA
MSINNVEPRHAGERQLTVRVVAMPADTNTAGDIFGGWLMSRADIAGSIVAIQVAKGRVVTVAVHEFLFIKPVLVGDLVSCYAEVIKRGNTSVRVKVDVYAERESAPETIEQVAEAEITYVAVDDVTRTPRPLP